MHTTAACNVLLQAVKEVIVEWVTVHGTTMKALLSNDALLNHRLPGVNLVRCTLLAQAIALLSLPACIPPFILFEICCNRKSTPDL